MSHAPRRNAKDDNLVNYFCVSPERGVAAWAFSHRSCSSKQKSGSSPSAPEAMLLSASSFPVLSAGCGETRPCQRGAGKAVGGRPCRRVGLGPGQSEIPALMRPRLWDTGWIGLSFTPRTQHLGVTSQGNSSSELLLVWEKLLQPIRRVSSRSWLTIH